MATFNHDTFHGNAAPRRDKLDPTTWARSDRKTTDGREVLINPANGVACVMAPAGWPHAHIPRAVQVYENELAERIAAAAWAMLAVLRKVASGPHRSNCFPDRCDCVVSESRAILARIDGEA